MIQLTEEPWAPRILLLGRNSWDVSPRSSLPSRGRGALGSLSLEAEGAHCNSSAIWWRRGELLSAAPTTPGGGLWVAMVAWWHSGLMSRMGMDTNGGTPGWCLEEAES